METTEEESTGQPWQVVLAPVPATVREAKAEGQESARPAGPDSGWHSAAAVEAPAQLC